jgi:hypothetical protein
VVDVVILTPGEMVMENVAVAVFDAESVTVTPKVGVPVAVGVPLSKPAAERVNPPGKVEPLLTAHVYPAPEPPVAARVCE